MADQTTSSDPSIPPDHLANPWASPSEERPSSEVDTARTDPSLSALSVGDAEAGKEATDDASVPRLEVSSKPVDLTILSEFDPLVESEGSAAWAQNNEPSSALKLLSAPGPRMEEAEADPSTCTPDVPISAQRPRTPQPRTPQSSKLSIHLSSTPPSPAVVSSPTTLSSLARPLRKASEHEAEEQATVPNGKAVKAPPPFDFQKFLDQMKTKSAEPVAKYLRSFLHNFAKKSFNVNEQVKLIHDFLAFIATKMLECDVWKNLPADEFDNAMEAMEKLVMNRLYHLTFAPAIDRSIYPITTDDLERDHILRQRIRLFSWVREEHLDIPTGEGSRGFIMFAEQELLKINHYKAPRDKLICVLNACKVIFGLIRHLNREEGADAFIPILIFVVLQANPEHLLSNVEYISRFRSAQKLQSEAGYYLSSLMGAISFIETMDHTSLSNISQEEFESNVEDAIQTLSPSPSPDPSTPTRKPRTPTTAPPLPTSPAAGEESARALILPTTLADTRRFFQRTGDLAQQTISKPLNAIGRIFSDALEEPPGAIARLFPGQSEPATPAPQQQQPPGPVPPQAAPYLPRIRRSPSRSSPQCTPLATPSRGPPNLAPFSFSPFGPSPASTPRRPSPDPDQSEDHTFDFSALSSEIDRAHDAAQAAGRDTLMQIFPELDGEVADMVLEANNGDLGLSIDKLLEMGVGS